ncbi:hypothetical protein EON67_12200 [archaeon]|nr:MAG: hypothetical protein EON67_12200 [archaeon]
MSAARACARACVMACGVRTYPPLAMFKNVPPQHLLRARPVRGGAYNRARTPCVPFPHPLVVSMSAAKAAFFKRPRLPVVRIILGVAVVGVTTKLALGHFALQHYKGLLDNKQAQVQKVRSCACT